MDAKTTPMDCSPKEKRDRKLKAAFAASLIGFMVFVVMNIFLPNIFPMIIALPLSVFITYLIVRRIIHYIYIEGYPVRWVRSHSQRYDIHRSPLDLGNLYGFTNPASPRYLDSDTHTQ